MPNSQHCFTCATMRPCKCKGLLSLFKGRPFLKFLKYLRRTAQRRRSTRRFRSVHAVFWPLMSMRSEDRERTAEHPSLTLTETETESETVLRPQPIEPAPLTSSDTNVEPSPPPTTSSYTKPESNPPLTTSSYTKTESNPPPTISSYTKTESNLHPTTSSYTKPESNPPPTTSSYTKTESSPPTTSSYTKIESSPPPTTSYTKIEPASPLTSSQAKLEPSPPLLTSSYAKRKTTRPTLTSSYNKMTAQIKKVEENIKDDDEVQRACRSFEKYIMEMLLEERKIRDLLDVEELMYCMDKLQSPAFVELVCTFYGELCVDLFSNGSDQPALEAGGN